MKKPRPKPPTKILILSIVLLAIFGWLWFLENPNPNIKYGVTFSSLAAKKLGLDPQTVYLSMIKELGVKHLRLPTYWNQLELKPDQFDFSEIDLMLDQAKANQVDVVLVVGRKQPRWPECYQPDWVKQLPDDQQQLRLLNYIKQSINRYREHSEIIAWQVENEPLFPFGQDCPVLGKSLLQEEVSLVKSFDPYRPIIITDSGELGGWEDEVRLSDILGVSLYRKIYDPHFGFFKYPLPPSFYIIKSDLTRLLFSAQNQKTWVMELQTEPWFQGDPQQVSIDYQSQIFTLQEFKDTVSFNQKVGFESSYLWGVEWWYYMKSQGHPEYWNYAQTLFNN